MGNLKVDFSLESRSCAIANFEAMRQSKSSPSLFNESTRIWPEKVKEGSPSKRKTILRVFDKNKFEQAMETVSLLVTIKGVAKAVLASIGAIFSRAKATISSSFNAFSSTWGFIPDGIELAPAAYALYDDSVHLVKAVQNGDREEIKDRSAGATMASMTLTGNVVGVAAYIETSKSTASAIAQGAALGTASGALGAVIWGVASLLQALSIKRIWKTISKVKQVFQSSIESEDQKLLKGVLEIRSQLEVSQKEELKIQEKAKGDAKVVHSLRAKLIEAKVNKLKKRVGEESFIKIREQIFGLSRDIEASQNQMSLSLKGRARRMLKIYKRSLNKQISLRIMKFAGTVIGFVGAVLAFSNPIGAGILAGIAAGILIYTWYKEKHTEVDEFKKITVFGKSTDWLHYEIESQERLALADKEEKEARLIKKAMIETQASYPEFGSDEVKMVTECQKRKKKLDKRKVISLDTYNVVQEESQERPFSSSSKRSGEKKERPLSSSVHEMEKEKYRAMIKKLEETRSLYRRLGEAKMR